MLLGVRCSAGKQLQVVEAVIHLDSIDVMHHFVASKKPAYGLFDDETMLVDVSIAAGVGVRRAEHGHISVLFGAAPNTLAPVIRAPKAAVPLSLTALGLKQPPAEFARLRLASGRASTWH